MKTTTNKTTANKVESKKEILLNSKNVLNDEKLLDINLDDLDSKNFDELLNSLASNIKQNKTEKEKIYKKENLTKSERQTLRKKRDRFINNVILFASNKDNDNLKKEINLFNEFYKENYFKNDYSENSIRQNNSDNDTKIKVKLFLQIIKKSK